MPANLTYPGLYVEELPSGVHPIAGVSTSDTAFIDVFSEGPVLTPTRVTGLDDFRRQFGAISSPGGYAVMQFFVNGGSVAWIVRVAPAGGAVASRTFQGGSAPSDTLVVSAASVGAWGNDLQAAFDNVGATAGTFNLAVRRLGTVNGKPAVVASEVFRGVTMNTKAPNYVINAVKSSALITVDSAVGHLGDLPVLSEDVTSPSAIGTVSNHSFQDLQGGADTGGPSAGDLVAGLEPLTHLEPAVVNLLCIPAAAELDQDFTTPSSWIEVAGEVMEFCDAHRCFYIADIPQGVNTPSVMSKWKGLNGLAERNAALYYPRLQIVDPDPLAKGALRDVASSGTIAGLYARTDADRGVWKAPAGTETQLRGVVTPSAPTLNDADSGLLNPLGINAIRTLPVYGTVCWGARTRDGADASASEWKYVPVRRTALYLEESLVQGLRWVVFEPNDEPLWSQIRLNVGSFMQSLFRKGAFQGATPREAYLVKCDSETTTQGDIDRGVVNILVGFAPLKPAEFVVIQIQQLTRPADQ